MRSVRAVDPAQARDDVRAILRGAPYRRADRQPPRPLDGVLSWLDDRLRPVGRFFGRIFAPVGRALASVWRSTFGLLPFPVALAIVGALLVAVLIAVARVLQRRAAPARATGAGGAHDSGGIVSPEQLEEQADAAERAGRLDEAVRLRFRAGLLRLERDAHAIRNRPGLTTREVRVRLASDRFEHVADTFEAVAYGGRDAEPDDTDDARTEWPRIVTEARRG